MKRYLYLVNYTYSFLFINIRWLDILDILLVALLLYQIYQMMKGTVAIRIFFGILSIYLLWKLVEMLKMKLLSEILGQFIGLGMLAIIIVFQQEIRRFLLFIGSPAFISKNKFFKKIFPNFFDKIFFKSKKKKLNIKAIINACINLSKTKTGALIVITRQSELKHYIRTGIEINADVNPYLIENIFTKNTALHDGAIIISNNKIIAVRCILPLTEKENLPAQCGLRHRAAVGITESSDAVSIIVSEETGAISISYNGELKMDIKSNELEEKLLEFFNIYE